MNRVIDHMTGEIVRDVPEGFVALDPMAPGGIADVERRPLWLATISAGHKVKSEKGFDIPAASKDGSIYVRDPDGTGEGLRAALKAKPDAGYPGTYVSEPHARLTVALAADAIEDIISQHFARRSATALEVYGDQYELTEILKRGEGVEHLTHAAGSDDYTRLVRTCKAETRMLFCLAEWQDDRSNIPFPDGLGWYSLRFTSRWSLQSLVGKLREVSSLTGGRLRGIPFGLFLAYQDVPGPDGKTRHIPVWRLEFKPPAMIQLNSGSLRGLLSGALEEGRKLQLIEAPRETLADAERDFDVDLDSDAAVETMVGQPRCDATAWAKRWFTLVKGTALEPMDARRDFMRMYTAGRPGGVYESLGEFLADATDAEAADLYGAAADEIGARASDEPLIDAPTKLALEMTYKRLKQTAPDDLETLTLSAARQRLGELVAAGVSAQRAPAEPTPPPSEPVAEPPASDDAYAAYGQVLALAGSLGIDLAGFDVTRETPWSEVQSKHERLAAECASRAQQGALF